MEHPEQPQTGPQEPSAAQDPQLVGLQLPGFATSTVVATSPSDPPGRARITVTSILLAVAAVVALGGVAFAVGRVTAPGAAANATTNSRLFGGAGQGRVFPGTNGLPNGGPLDRDGGGLQLRGTITGVDGDTLTVQLANGNSIEVTTSSSTTYHRQVAGTAADVGSGSTVIVQVGGAAGLRGLLGQGGAGTASVPATDVTVAGP